MPFKKYKKINKKYQNFFFFCECLNYKDQKLNSDCKILNQFLYALFKTAIKVIKMHEILNLTIRKPFYMKRNTEKK